MKEEKILISRKGKNIFFRHSIKSNFCMIVNAEILPKTLEKLPQRIFLRGGCIEFKTWFQAVACFFTDPMNLIPGPIFMDIHEFIKTLQEKCGLWDFRGSIKQLEKELSAMVVKSGTITCYGKGEEIKVKGISSVPPQKQNFPWEVKNYSRWQAKVVPVQPQCHDNGGYVVPLEKILNKQLLVTKFDQYFKNPQPISP